MIVFIDDRPVRLTGSKKGDKLARIADFDRVVDARLESLKAESLNGHLLLLNATPATAERLIGLLEEADISDLLSVTLQCLDKDAVESRIKSLYKVVKAAGGVVTHEGRMLLIFRRGVWDLPKGKLDDGESSKDGAVREVEEETGAIVSLGDKICTTYHTYTLNGNRILKRTKWYHMALVDDTNLAPQAEENIEKVAFMEPKQAKVALAGSFSSIRHVVEQALMAKQPKA
ncbi:NUDIX hydrolase [uncultured Fibrella sp.]|uniref:NUDIX hydrolase n=1 Tax=uncultured Fibrella sp. TaxID=1284596 RepID=UPI0035CB02A9